MAPTANDFYLLKMSRLRAKKTIIFILISIIIFSGLFYYLIGVFTAKAQEQIKIFPTAFSGEWKNPEAAFSQDLSENATFEEFNTNNSAYPLEQKQQEEPTSFWDSPTQIFWNKFSQVLKNRIQEGKIWAGKVKNFFKEVVFAQEETRDEEEILPPEEEPITEEPIAEEPIAEEPITEETPPAEEPLPQEEPPAEPIIEEPIIEEEILPIEKTLELSNFSISEDFSDKIINNVQLRLSLAGKGEIGDKLVIEYYYLARQSFAEQNLGGWQSLATFDLENEFSNALNGGYFLYGLPVFENWTDLENLKIKFTYSGYQNSKVFLDGLWLEVEYEEISEEEPPEIIEAEPQPMGERKDFRSDEEPKFSLEGISPENAGILEKIASFFRKKEITEAILINPRGEESSEGVVIEGSMIKIKPDQRSFKPGLYKLKIKKGEEEIIQEFSWGVLAINTNKSIYLPNETVYLQMAVLNDGGHTICDANLTLEITSPHSQIISPTIQQSGECGPDNVTDKPDYFVYYQTSGVGVYEMKLTNLDNGYEIEDSFEVRESAPFDVERIGPTRIYPPASYQMTLRVKVNQDFTGEIKEYVPNSFVINDQFPISNFQSISNDQNSKQIIWQVDWKAGETQELKYQFDAPDISPYLYLLGPLEIGDFREIRQWQIASDSTTKQFIISGTASEPSTSATQYSCLMGDGNSAWTATEDARRSLIPASGKLSNFKVRVKTAPAAGKSWTFAIRISGAASNLSVTISDTNTISSLDTDEVTVSAGDDTSISATPSGTPTAAEAVYWTVQFTPDTSGETILLSSSNGVTFTNNNYRGLVGNKANETVEFEAQIVFPTSGTLKKLYLELNAAPGAGTSKAIVVRKNGADTSLVATVSDTSTAGNDTVNTVSIAAGDKVTYRQSVSGIPADSYEFFGIAFVPDTPGEYIAAAVTDDKTSSTAAEYQHLTTGDSALTATENEVYNLAQETTAKAIYVNLGTAPGSGYTWTFRLRDDAANTSLVVSISDTNTSGNYAADVSIGADSVLDTAIDAQAGSLTSATQISYLFYNAPAGNQAPSFTVGPAENPASTATSPTNSGSNVTFEATATDTADSWKLLICKENSVNPSQTDPTCGGTGEWCKDSSFRASGVQSSCSYTTTDSDAESKDWYAFACDNNSSPACSAANQGSGDSGYPFKVNRGASFTVVTDSNDPVNPGDTVTITTTADDPDSDGGADTLDIFVCKTAGATAVGCDGGDADTWCKDDTTNGETNPTCNWTMNVAKTGDVTANQCEGAYSYWAYIFDNHGFAATATGGQQGTEYTNTVSNVAPEVTAVSLNSGSNFQLSTEQSSDNIVVTGTVVDNNGCVDIDDATTADTSIYYYKSGVTGYAECDDSPGAEDNDNYCYSIRDCAYNAGSCTGTADSDSTFTCTVAIKYHANPTDGANSTDSTWWDYTWRATLIGQDEALSDTMESTDIEMLSFMAYDVDNGSAIINYGGPLAPDEISSDKTNTVEATGNVGLDVNLYSVEPYMCTVAFPACENETMVIAAQHWGATDDTWDNMTPLTQNTTDELELNCPKSTGGTPASANVHWKIKIPNPQAIGSYTGENTIAGKKGEAQDWVAPEAGSYCFDGIDNDGDGYIDCLDSGCSGAHDTGSGVYIYCRNNHMWTETLTAGYTWGHSEETVGNCPSHPDDNTYPACYACYSLTYAGFTDWVLADKNTLVALWDGDGGYFDCDAANCTGWDTKCCNSSGSPASIYWSSTEYNSSGAWSVLFHYGGTTNAYKYLSMSVRCLRQ